MFVMDLKEYIFYSFPLVLVLITKLLTCEGASQTEHLLMNGRTCSPDTGFIIGVIGSGVDNQ